MNTVFDELLLGHANKFEGKLEKKLREVGEMFVDLTESKLRSSGKFSFFFLEMVLVIKALFLLGIMG